MIRLFRLSSRERRLLLRALVRLLQVRARLLFATPDLRTFYRSEVSMQKYSPTEIAVAFGRAAKLLPRTQCLPIALAAASLLQSEGYDCELRIGVKQSDGNVAAHAWVVVNGKTVIGGSLCQTEFQVLPAMPPYEQGDLA